MSPLKYPILESRSCYDSSPPYLHPPYQALQRQNVPEPIKRRKFQEPSKMARRTDLEHDDSQSQGDHDDTHLETSCDLPDATESSPTTPHPAIETSDRDELIQCIKRGQRPTWVPKPGLQALYAEEEALQMKRNTRVNHYSPVSPTSANFQFEDDLLFGPWTGTSEFAEHSRSPTGSGYFDAEEYPNSAKSSGPDHLTSFLGDESICPLSASPPPYLDETSYPPIGQATTGSLVPKRMFSARPNRPRAPSLSSNFVMRVPTSPLVHAVNNPNLDFSPRTTPNDDNEERKNRRRTMPPNSLQSYSPTSTDTSITNFSRPLAPPPLRRGSSVPQQAHQPRKSLGSFTFQSSPGFQGSDSPLRRCSVAPDVSPKRRTSMVGSFEESIVRGRMSSPASKPFDFVAQIGVMGKGDCPANLKCPSHVSVPFQAVFYSYPSSQFSRSVADDAPSPYVGTVDLEHNLKPVQLATKKRTSTVGSIQVDRRCSSSDPRAPENTPIGKALARDAQLQLQQQEQAKPGSRISLGGAYRVPQQGQLQIIIKTSTSTAVKLFLVPYDLEGMDPGTKTFIRQKSYSTGPIVESALSEKSQSPNVNDPLKDKQILRYLIHIKFCCPSKGKYYLYDNVRVVFANRVPDGKEKLRNEVQLPEPKYSPWKPVHTHQRSASSVIDIPPVFSTPSYTSPPATFDDIHAMRAPETASIPEEVQAVTPPRLPFNLPYLSRRREYSYVRETHSNRSSFVFPDIPIGEDKPIKPEQAVSPVQGFLASTSPRSSPVPWGNGSASSARSFSPTPVEAGNGLLSRQFRGLHKSSVDNELETASDPWAATASLTRMLSQSDAAPSSEQGEPKTT